jgi:tagaturonate reductase
LISIALNSIPKFKVRVLPSILEYERRTGNLPEGLLYSLASLIRFYKGEWQEESIPLNDSGDILEFFRKAWTEKDLEVIVRKILSNESFWGLDLTKIDGLEFQVKKSLEQIEAAHQVL